MLLSYYNNWIYNIKNIKSYIYVYILNFILFDFRLVILYYLDVLWNLDVPTYNSNQVNRLNVEGATMAFIICNNYVICWI